MINIVKIINNIKNIIPYLLLVSLYFFVVNLEARREKDAEKHNKIIKEVENKLNQTDKNTIKYNDNYLYNNTISIPVIPYEKINKSFDN